MAEESPVILYVYDLSGGLAARLSPGIIGKQIGGIWHTGVVVYGREYYFGSMGIGVVQPGTLLGEPLDKIDLGTTFIPYSIFEEYLNGLAESEFKGTQYDLLKHNCNNFSDTISQFLVGKKIPDHITSLPSEILNSSFGQTFAGFINQIAQHSPHLQRLPNQIRPDSPDFQQLNSDIEAVRQHSLALREKRNALNEKLARREKKKNKKRKGAGGESSLPNGIDHSIDKTMSEAEVVPETNSAVALADQIEEQERREREERKKSREPAIVFKDAVDVHIEFDTLVGLIDGKLNDEEQQSLEELHQYMLQDEGSWALGDQFLVFVGRLLTDSSLAPEISVRCLNVLAAAALKDDVILMLHQDRKHHILMNYAHDVDRLPLAQQRALTLFICNLFENSGSSEWLMYISEWQFNNISISNIRVTTKVAVNAILSEDDEMKDRGTAIVYNLAMKEVFDDVAVELTMAVLQFLNTSPSEVYLFRSLKALERFCQISTQDVPQLIQMIGPLPSSFKGVSDRNDTIINEINKRLR